MHTAAIVFFLSQNVPKLTDATNPDLKSQEAAVLFLSLHMSGIVCLLHGGQRGHVTPLQPGGAPGHVVVAMLGGVTETDGLLTRTTYAKHENPASWECTGLVIAGVWKSRQAVYAAPCEPVRLCVSPGSQRLWQS